MMWETAKLGDYIDIQSGYAFKSNDFTDRGIPVIKIKNITPPSVSLDDLSFVPNEVAELTQKFLLNYNDVLIALTGSHINQMASVVGRVARVKYNQPSMLNQRVARITIKDSTECDIDYVYYYLSQDEIKIKLASNAGGAANQANISPSDVKNLIIPFPKYKRQKAISSILSAYDDLIENNQKQIKLLEEAARRLYKEWFVDLRFPGHETTSIVDGMPEGWQMKSISDFGVVITGKTPSTSQTEFYDGDIPFVKIPDMHNCVFPISTESTLSELGANSQKNKYIPKNSIMVSCIGTVGLVNISFQSCQTNQQINSIVLDNQFDIYYLYFCMEGIQSLLDGVGSNGATMTNVNKSKFENLSLIYPSNELIDLFYHKCKPIFDKILGLSVINYKLKEARDRLLPKLMNGEIEV